MFYLGLLYRLREQDVPVGPTEALALGAALKAGAHDHTVRGFYYIARATMIHHEGHLDAFDRGWTGWGCTSPQAPPLERVRTPPRSSSDRASPLLVARS